MGEHRHHFPLFDVLLQEAFSSRCLLQLRPHAHLFSALEEQEQEYVAALIVAYAVFHNGYVPDPTHPPYSGTLDEVGQGVAWKIHFLPLTLQTMLVLFLRKCDIHLRRSLNARIANGEC